MNEQTKRVLAVAGVVPRLLEKLSRSYLDRREATARPIPISKAKQRRNIVTRADTSAESFLAQELRAQFPDIALLSEEHCPQPNSLGPTYWVIDALDGTLNYSQDIPHYSTSVALVHESKTIYGCIRDHRLYETFQCIRGQGVTRQGEPLQRLSYLPLQEVMVAVGHGYDDARASIISKVIQELQPHVRGIRQTGCASLDMAYVAAGRFGGVIHPFLSVWDRLAGELMVEEVGGRVVDVEELGTGDTKARIVASEWIVEDLNKAIRKILVGHNNHEKAARID